jgi:1-deoxy-D-xylulose-5-phosphate reductoisomerase
VPRKTISILGSTGSIGRQTLEVVSSLPGKFEVFGLSAKNNVPLLEDQIKKFSPQIACVETEADAKALISRLGKTKTTVYFGDGSLTKLAKLDRGGILVVSIPGIKALHATIAALRSGLNVALASKEILVAAGKTVMGQAWNSKAGILPLDSEHSAIAQCLRGEDDKKIKKIILTASGGPFLGKKIEELQKVTPETALSHPTWKMGKRITIDSATLMNKGFEVIEAHHLFGVDYSKIEVLIHPQSVIHSMVEFEDGSTIAQMGAPDMRIPIQYALQNYNRTPNKWNRLDLREIKQLTFQPVDDERFPCLGLAYMAGKRGGSLPAVMSAADQAAVDLFLSGKIKFIDIPGIIESVMKKHEIINDPSIEELIEADSWAKNEALSMAD